MSNYDVQQQIFSPAMLASNGQNKTKAKGGTVGDGQGGAGGSWYEALVSAWGNALDVQAAKIEGLANTLEGINQTIATGTDPGATPGQVAAGNLAGKTDQPSILIQLTGESQKMGFLSASASTSINAVGEAEAALGRKG